MEVLRDGETALFVDPLSPRQIAEKVKLLVENPGMYEAIAKRAQALVEHEFSWENYAKKILAAANLTRSK